MTSWALISGEYPPQPGGVSDHSRIVAHGLAAAGDEVHVWAPPWHGQAPADDAVAVHRLPDWYGARSLLRLGTELDRHRCRRILVQYVPHAYGWKGMNVGFCLWLAAQRGREVIVVFHEVAFPRSAGAPLGQQVLARVQDLMAGLATHGALSIFVTIPAWEASLGAALRPGCRVRWLPVPSNIPSVVPEGAPERLRRSIAARGGHVLAHFGTYGAGVTRLLVPVLLDLLRADASRRAVLAGRGSVEFTTALLEQKPWVSGRIHATDALPAADVAAHLAASDLLVQPYPDGVTGRRGSLMAGLALGIPVLTNDGPLSEPLWRESRAVALASGPDPTAFVALAEELLRDGEARAALAARGRTLYAERFAIEHTLAALRDGQGRAG